MQDTYFSLWLGIWPSAIDWTAAVTNTYVSATLSTLSRRVAYKVTDASPTYDDSIVDAQGRREIATIENTINKYFAQISAFYYGEDAFAVRMQAYDDILWVVLEWLESIRFIETHSRLHYTRTEEYYATQFIPAFAHRARVFYELAEKGWDDKLCGGGLTWNPKLLPYKNAITNELFVSASVGMYLHFPGDENCSPLLAAQTVAHKKSCYNNFEDCADRRRKRKKYDQSFLDNAIKGYDWLRNSGMLNEHGLYTDGFHISGYRQNQSRTICDERNDMVYTYNQGVILSSLRGLWEATGNTTYLEDGHELVRNVIRATGWKSPQHFSAGEEQHEADVEGYGLGANGILEEACDASGTCNQDGQMFKGIFFHHFTAFCETLPRRPVTKGKTFGASKDLAGLHRKSCASYAPWIERNANAALKTRSDQGIFGMWWGTSLGGKSMEKQVIKVDVETESTKTDYRNNPKLLAAMDILPDDEWAETSSSPHSDDEDMFDSPNKHSGVRRERSKAQDPNTRGRGRTLETQTGGLSVVRAMLEFPRRKSKYREH